MGRRVFAGADAAALRAVEEYEDHKKAETERLLAVHYHRRQKSVARGFVVEHRKMPRGWHHALAARHPVTRRGLLHPRAITLLNKLYEEAEKVAAASGALRVFGKSQGFYANVCGLSMRRGRNGEVYGARRIREYLRQLANLNIIKKGGRCWFDGPGKHPRLVLWIQPFETWTLTRFAEAVTTLSPSENGGGALPSPSDSDRISRSGCSTENIEINSELCGGMGGTGGKEAPSAPSIDSSPSTTAVDNTTALCPSPSVNMERPSAASAVSDRPSAGASDGEKASSGPATDGAKLDAAKAVMLLGATALRVFRGRELGELIQHVARTHTRPVDAADGRPPRLPSSSVRRAPGALPARLAVRPHPTMAGALPCMCDDCKAWARAVIAAPSPARDPNLPTIRPPERVHRSPWAEARRSAVSYEAAPPAQLGAAIAGATSRHMPTPAEARARSIRWERSRCYAPEGKRCKPGDRRPCRQCVDVDFPFRAVVDGRPWKLRYDGPGQPFVLVVDGCELGAVEWPASWRSFGTPTTTRYDGNHDDGD